MLLNMERFLLAAPENFGLRVLPVRGEAVFRLESLRDGSMPRCYCAPIWLLFCCRHGSEVDDGSFLCTPLSCFTHAYLKSVM
jgi:hypothetical protein